MTLDLDPIRARLAAATPGPWFWWGNTDHHGEALCGRQPGLGVCEVLSTVRVNRSRDSLEAQQLRANLEDCGYNEDAIEDEVDDWATDESGSPRFDERLSLTDEKFIRRAVSEVAVYEVARAQGLRDDTPRDHPKVYRADICDVRNANGQLIANAPADLVALLAEVERLRVAVWRVREMHYPAYNDVAHTRLCESCHGKAGVHPCGCWSDGDYQPVCGHCRRGHKFSAVAYPCPTIRALDGAE